MKRTLLIALVALAVALIVGTVRHPHFWSTPDRQGDALMQAKKYAEAAKVYTDPRRIGIAQYRNGDFEAAARTFARVPGAEGAFDQGNAWLMHGQYETAIAIYDRALTFQPGWQDAEENKALALARKAKLDASGKDRDQEQTNSNENSEPDEIVFDQKGNNKRGEPTELAGGDMSDKELNAMWLRRVQTTPGDFLRAKFAYQAAKEVAP